MPEGGIYSPPERRAGDGVVVCGHAAGFVEVASLKGAGGMHVGRAIRR